MFWDMSGRLCSLDGPDVFVHEDIVVDRVPNGAADDADREGEGGYGGDEVVRADDVRDDAGRDDDACAHAIVSG